MTYGFLHGHLSNCSHDMCCRVALLGTSPRFLSEIKGQGINPCTQIPPKLIYGSIDNLRFVVRDIGPFESLRMIASTGAVLTAPMFEWVQEAFGPEKQVVSSSGGTDVCAACESVFTLVYQMVRSLTR